MRTTRWAAVAVSGLVLAGCGSADEPAASAGSPALQEQTRAVEHAMGTAEVAGTPGRVVVLDTGELDATLALGVTPVGAVRTSVSDELPAFVQEAGVDPAAIENVGTIEEPDLEAIAALEPDLILTNVVRHEALHDQLEQIAPTVMAENVAVTWKENLELAGEALDRADQARQLLEDYTVRADQVGALYGDAAATEVSVARFVDGSSVRLYGEGSFIGTVLADAGFGRPPVQQVDDFFVEVSREQVDQAAGDLLFYGAYGEEGQGALGEVTGGGLWQSLAPVQEGRAFEVDDDRWFLGLGPLGAGLVLDDLEGFAGQLQG